MNQMPKAARPGTDTPKQRRGRVDTSGPFAPPNFRSSSLPVLGRPGMPFVRFSMPGIFLRNQCQVLDRKVYGAGQCSKTIGEFDAAVRGSLPRMTLAVTPIDFAEANAFVAVHHRHHKPMPGVKFCIAVSDLDELLSYTRQEEHLKVVGVAMVGRPVARGSDTGWTLEVNRCCTDGTRNACSMLYGAAWRAAKALGYRRLITYTLPAEGGASLRADWLETLGRARRRKLEFRLPPKD